MRCFLNDFLDSLLHPGVHQVEEKGDGIEEERGDGAQVAPSSISVLSDLILFLVMRIHLDDEVLVLRGKAERVPGHTLYEG